MSSDLPARLLRPEEIALIERRAEVASPGPWRTDDGDVPNRWVLSLAGYIVCETARSAYCRGRDGADHQSANADLIAASITDIPALVESHRLLERMIGDMAADEGAGCLLRMRRALGEIVARHQRAKFRGSELAAEMLAIAHAALGAPPG